MASKTPRVSGDDADSEASTELAEDVGSKDCVCHCRQGGIFSPEETLIILDWDDTLFPTTWVHRRGFVGNACAEPSDQQVRELRVAAKSAARALSFAKLLGTVVLVTNAREGWVELACERFAPELALEVAGVRCVSARSLCEGRVHDSPLEWKRFAFQGEIDRFCDGLEENRWANFISIGDSSCERLALLSATQHVQCCYSKSLKLGERPNARYLAKELDLVGVWFERIVDFDDDLNIAIQRDSSGSPRFVVSHAEGVADPHAHVEV